MMRRLIERGRLHLHQAFGTTFTGPAMQQYIRKYGTGQGAKDILAGNFDPNVQDNLPAENHQINHHLHRVATPDSININLTTEELQVLMKTMQNNKLVTIRPSLWP
eukprot:2905972-Ditylum_brightwellii.AAC.2